MIHSRNLAPFVDSLGGDSQSSQPELVPAVSPIYILGDQRWSVPNRGSARLFTNFIPSTLAAQFSGFEIVASKGMWIRRFANFGPGNAFWGFKLNIASLLSTVDATPVVTYAMPEGSQFSSRTTTNPLDGTVPGFPNLFTQFQVGRTLVGVVGVFMPANTTRDEIVDVWVPPNIMFYAGCNVANTVVQFDLDIDFPAECVN